PALSPQERRFLSSLLSEGSPVLSPAAPGAPPPSMLADAVNEKLYDVFGDTVLLWEGDRLTPAPEYIEELRGIVE
ncbi:MAG: tellurite resistance TerB C-terminal domain-containing protein, partial [Bacillota bacterium]|nr:tellurite resistance TerB C-terminal domain-containing protein [Bacillota bacterium]